MNTRDKQTAMAGSTTGEGADTALRAAQSLAGRKRKCGLAALDALFQGGRPPDPPLHGRYRGQLVALDVAPGLTLLAAAVTARWMPWQGKRFDAIAARGDNIFTDDSRTLAHLFWPLYRRFSNGAPGTYHAFAFHTAVAPGLIHPTFNVLKIDYDLPENPRLSIRRVLDELVQLSPQLFLGQALVHWWWGQWQRVAYFTLRPKGEWL